MHSTFSLIMPIFLGAYGGHKVDTPGEFPFWTIVGSFIGLTIGAWNLYRQMD